MPVAATAAGINVCLGFFREGKSAMRKKVLVAQFVTESNANIPYKTDLENYDLRFGEDAISQMNLGSVFADADIEVVPSVYANGFSGGVVTRNAFDYIENRLLNDIRANLGMLDGMFLHLHGASEVEDIGSGDHHILKEVRRLVGPYMPIVVACDPHGNLCKEYVDGCTVIRSYRESPHTDLADTVKTCCRYLVDLLEHRRNIHPAYRKLPLILGGEQSVSADEPVRSINQYMDEMEKTPASSVPAGMWVTSAMTRMWPAAAWLWCPIRRPTRRMLSRRRTNWLPMCGIVVTSSTTPA